MASVQECLQDKTFENKLDLSFDFTIQDHTQNQATLRIHPAASSVVWYIWRS